MTRTTMNVTAGALCALLCAGLSPDAAAAYRRGDLLWRCDFTRAEVDAMKTPGIASGRNWDPAEGVAGDGAFHAVSKGGDCKVSVPLPTERLRGRMIQVEARVKGLDVTPGPRHFNGPKLMLAFRSGGKAFYPEMPKEYGTWDWKRRAKVEFVPADATNLAFVLGLESCTGELWVDDLAVYAAEEVPDEPPSVEPKNPLADAIPRGPYARAPRAGGWRGVMSPGREMTEDDAKTLADWNANLVRLQLQIRRPKGAEGDAWYFEALAKRLDALERELALCGKYGLRACIDLHSGPAMRQNKHAGNTLGADYDTAGLRRAWRMIATRFSGNPLVYGYDILNEPAVAPAAWDRIFRETVAEIRQVDRVTPVVTEFLNYHYPEEMNVIYSPHFYSPHTLTHFGVGGIGRVRWSYGNYVNGEFLNKDQLRVYMKDIIDFGRAHPEARIFIGEFSCILWAKGADRYIADCIELFEEYGWDWTYHAFREWPPWDVEFDHDADYTVGKTIRPTGDSARKRALLKGLKNNGRRVTPLSGGG